MRIPDKDAGDVGKVGILRLRRGAADCGASVPLRMTIPNLAHRTIEHGVGHHERRFKVPTVSQKTRQRWGRFLVLFITLSAATAWGTTYYVSSSSGNDANAGTSAGAAWQTVAKVNAQTFLPGDSILFKRGDVWNESLVPSSSGASGNPITVDAYGAGPAPILSGYYAVPASSWVLVSGNAWKAPVPSTFTTINFCLFGSVWGQKVGASTANLVDQWDFYFANGYLYVYSASGSPATYYGEPIVPMALTNTPVINVNGKSWLTFQHFLINWFDQYGVYVHGASDHLVFANMEADSMIPQGTQPLGFYVNESAPGPSDLKIYNSEAHLNYDGFRFDGSATAITMINDKAYANRDGALVDNTSAVTYSYCHFYASSLAVAGSTDVLWTSGTGPTAGAGNIAADTSPTVQAWKRYPAQVSLTVDDAGMTAGADTYYANTVLPTADAAGVAVGAAITVGYPLAQTLIPTFQGWINAGRDVTSHSISHTYYTNTDGLSRKFYMSQKPFPQSKRALIDEKYLGSSLDPAIWVVSDPAGAISVVAETLQVAGGNGNDGQTTVNFIEQIELGGALELQHGDVSFSGPSQGVLGGLYAGAISTGGCLAGFHITSSGAGSNIQALVNGSATGPVIATALGHRYVLTTYLYSMEVYRSQEIYHSSSHPAGEGLGGGTIAADVRVVLEIHDVDPANPATMVAPGTVLYDGVISAAPAFSTYALVNAVNMHCGIAYTYARHISLAEVRTALPNSGYVTQLVGSQADGGECLITSDPALEFYPAYAPAVNELIVVSYRGYARAVAEVENSASVNRLQNGSDDGVRGLVREMKSPGARTSSDCENAALAVLDDAAGQAWSGSYESWSDFLPGGAADIFPGDALAVNVPSCNAAFSAIVRQVAIQVVDPANDRGVYTIEFANDLAAPLALQFGGGAITISLQDMPPRLTTSQVGTYYLTDLTEAQITQVSSTTVQVDAGLAPGQGYGIEVRAHDYGWGPANDRNLLGRFGAQAFTLPRLARTQDYFLRLYDNSSPPRYSRYSAALHLDYPL